MTRPTREATIRALHGDHWCRHHDGDCFKEAIERAYAAGEAAGRAAGAAAEREATRAKFLAWRGVEDPCVRCGGSGIVTYGSTATWRGGGGGQMLTDGVCDRCWGSGDEHRHGANLRAIRARGQEPGDECCLEGLHDCLVSPSCEYKKRGDE